ncbi:MAG: hypothetical protein AAGF33_15505, partial [Pseudomonadota bacterium]
SPQAHTLPMRTDDPLLPLAIEQISLVVFSLIGWTGIHLSLRRPVKWKLRRAGTKLKVLEGLVRKLIMVMALDLDLAPVKPRPKLSAAPADGLCDDATQPSDSIEIILVSASPAAKPMPPAASDGFRRGRGSLPAPPPHDTGPHHDAAVQPPHRRSAEGARRPRGPRQTPRSIPPPDPQGR